MTTRAPQPHHVKAGLVNMLACWRAEPKPYYAEQLRTLLPLADKLNVHLEERAAMESAIATLPPK